MGRHFDVKFKAKFNVKDLPTLNIPPESEEGAECPTCYGTGRIGTTDWLTKNISKTQLAEEKAKAEAEEKARLEREANPTTEDLLKKIILLLENK